MGIIAGKGNNLFDPNGSLTLAEAITLAVKTNAKYKNDELPVNSGGKWYEGAVAYAKENEVITGLEFSNYEVKATRAEMAYLFAHAGRVGRCFDALSRYDGSGLHNRASGGGILAELQQIRYRCTGQ